MLSIRDLVKSFRQLDLETRTPLMVHASLSSLGEVRGGTSALLAALIEISEQIMMPTFTYKSLLVPAVGPENNGICYGCGDENNFSAEFFYPDMPADPLMGELAEALRLHPRASRSSHPVLSFAGIEVEQALNSQTLQEPLAPVRVLAQQGGWVLLVGVGHEKNVSIHYAESLAGRKQFTRWALTRRGVVECVSFPGCCKGFSQLDIYLEGMTRQVQVNGAKIRAIPIEPLVNLVVQQIKDDPYALLCTQSDCLLCNAVRTHISNQTEQRI